MISNYNPCAAVAAISPANTVSAVKSFCEASAAFDAAGFPSLAPSLAVLALWLQKAIVAREAAVAYQLAANKVHLEA